MSRVQVVGAAWSINDKENFLKSWTNGYNCVDRNKYSQFIIKKRYQIIGILDIFRAILTNNLTDKNL